MGSRPDGSSRFGTCSLYAAPGHLIGSGSPQRARAGDERVPHTEVQISGLFLKLESGLFAALSPHARTFVQNRLNGINFVPRGLMDRVQLADTPHGRGCQSMSDTDTTTLQTPRMTRPSALGDLRFAGTIAAGLVAGTLGLGALAAPLVGWKDWPSALAQDAIGHADASARQAADAAHAEPGTLARRAARHRSAAGPGSATALVSLGGAARRRDGRHAVTPAALGVARTVLTRGHPRRASTPGARRPPSTPDGPSGAVQARRRRLQRARGRRHRRRRHLGHVRDRRTACNPNDAADTARPTTGDGHLARRPSSRSRLDGRQRRTPTATA